MITIAKPSSKSQKTDGKEQLSKFKDSTVEKTVHDTIKTAEDQVNAYFVLEHHNFYSHNNPKYVLQDGLYQNEQRSETNIEYLQSGSTTSGFEENKNHVGSPLSIMLENEDYYSNLKCSKVTSSEVTLPCTEDFAHYQEEELNNLYFVLEPQQPGQLHISVPNCKEPIASDIEYSRMQSKKLFAIRGSSNGIPKCDSLTVKAETGEELGNDIGTVNNAADYSGVELKKTGIEWVQNPTATEDEYNRIEFKKLLVKSGPNYCVPKCKSLAADVDTDEEYSHLEKNVDTVNDAVNYSHAELKKKDLERMQDCGNPYENLHINIGKIK